MWLDNLKELKKRSGLSTKQIAERTRLPERTVCRIFSGETDHPYADTLDIIAKSLGCDLGDVFSDTNVVVATEELVNNKESADEAKAELSLAISENKILRTQLTALTSEVELLKRELQHKEELLAVHNFYAKYRMND